MVLRGLRSDKGARMTGHALISDLHYRQPEQRLLKHGWPFVTATIRAKGNDTSQWWKVLAFSDAAQGDLTRLSDGNASNIQGALKVETYERDGELKFSLSVVADDVLVLPQPPRRRERKAADENLKAPISRTDKTDKSQMTTFVDKESTTAMSKQITDTSDQQIEIKEWLAIRKEAA